MVQCLAGSCWFLKTNPSQPIATFLPSVPGLALRPFGPPGPTLGQQVARDKARKAATQKKKKSGWHLGECSEEFWIT